MVMETETGRQGAGEKEGEMWGGEEEGGLGRTGPKRLVAMMFPQASWKGKQSKIFATRVSPCAVT